MKNNGNIRITNSHTINVSSKILNPVHIGRDIKDDYLKLKIKIEINNDLKDVALYTRRGTVANKLHKGAMLDMKINVSFKCSMHKGIYKIMPVLSCYDFKILDYGDVYEDKIDRTSLIING